LEVRSLKPIIGVTLNFEEGKYNLNSPYIQSIIQAGGIPVGLPYVGEQDVGEVLGPVDGLLLTGGGDINPLLFGEEPHPKLGSVLTQRDVSEIALTKAALQKKIPIFGVCRGLQILNVAFGGTIYQDLYSQAPNRDHLLKHAQKSPRDETSHLVHIKEDTKLRKLLQQSRIEVNSFHHQAINRMADDLVVCGMSSDGVIEAIEHPKHSFCIGVQWHPEELVMVKDVPSRKLFEAFVQASKVKSI
jgi:putative glutamine amidotransferase